MLEKKRQEVQKIKVLTQILEHNQQHKATEGEHCDMQRSQQIQS